MKNNKKKIKTETQRLIVNDVKKFSTFLTVSVQLDGNVYNGVLINDDKKKNKKEVVEPCQ